MISNNDKATDNKEEHSADNNDETSNNNNDNKEDKIITSFSSDDPINNKEDDIIGSNGFAKGLGNSILKYKEKESLVIALCGEWGQGKSSVINLTKKYLKNAPDNKLTIIDFNPWSFSEENITGCFFNEIATKLEKTKSNTKDEKIAKNLRDYAGLISSAPNQKTATWLINFLFVIPAMIIGEVSRYFITFITKYYNSSISILTIAIISIIIAFIIVFFFRNLLIKMANFFNKRTNYHFKSISEIKKDLEDRLEKRKENILIIIDDIDRLNKEEIKQLFKLIKNNANFPSFIYLTSFDRKIVEKNLESEQEGADYLSKIVQVSFDIPLASEDKILKLISEKLFVEIYLKLSEQAQKYFPDKLRHLKDDYSKLLEEAKKDLLTKVHGALRCFYEFKDYTSRVGDALRDALRNALEPKDYTSRVGGALRGALELKNYTSIDWSHKHPRDGCFYSFREFFKNIRDVKRFFNSLRFNISRMINEDVIKVNPIDFIALEAIRVFTPDFYNYMRDDNDYLFLPVIKSQQKSSIPAGLATEPQNKAKQEEENKRKEKKEKLEKALKEYTGKDSRYEKPLKDLLMRLFPQISWIYDEKDVEYYNLTTEQSKSKWKTEQRICDPELYNAYFIKRRLH
jgi:predicted KAP-like P-loop ATPase